MKENVIIGRLIPAGTGLQRKHKIAVDEDPEAVAYAKAHADILKVEELRARPTQRTSLEMDEIFATPLLESADLGELAAAGMSIDEGVDGGLAILDDESEPSPLDILGAQADLAEGEDVLAGLSSDE